MMNYVHKSEGNKSADDNQRIEDVPQVATVGAWVKKYSAIYNLQQATKQLGSVGLRVKSLPTPPPPVHHHHHHHHNNNYIAP